MATCSLNCSVCKVNYKGDYAGWLRHLLHERHQILARRELPKWEKIERTSVLVVFGRKAVGKDDRVIQFLSKDFGTFVTDFVWWPERPRVGFVQFESSKKTKEVLGTFQNCQFRIDQEQLCQVREGESIPELEWLGLFPEGETTLAPSPELPHPSNAPSNPTEDFGEQPPLKKARLGSSHEGSSLKLMSHLSAIRKLIEIPDEDYNFALEIKNQIQGVLSENVRNRRPIWKQPPAEAVISRHWLLKLQYSPKVADKNVPLCVIICQHLDIMDPDAAPTDRTSLKRLNNKIVKLKSGGKQTMLSHDVVATRHDEVSKRWGFNTGDQKMFFGCKRKN